MSESIPIQDTRVTTFDAPPVGASEAVAQQQAMISGYGQLLEDIRSIQVERAYRASMELIEGRYEIGQAIWQSGLYERHAYGSRLVPTLARDLDISARNLHYALAFYTKAQEHGGLDAFLEQVPKHRLNWGTVRQMLGKVDELPPPPEAKPEGRITARSIRRAVTYTRKRIGKLWTEDDAHHIEMMLREKHGAVTGRKPGDDPNPAIRAHQEKEAQKEKAPSALEDDWGDR